MFNRTPAYDGIVERMKKYEEAQRANEKLSEDSGDTRPGDLGKTTSRESGKEHFGARLRRPKSAKDDNGLQESHSSASSGCMSCCCSGASADIAQLRLVNQMMPRTNYLPIPNLRTSQHQRVSTGSARWYPWRSASSLDQ